MPAIRVLAGPYNYINFFAMANSDVTVTDENSLFPEAKIYNGRPIDVFKFGTAAIPTQLNVDINQVLNPGIESWAGGAPASWTVSTSGGGTVTETTTAGEVITGSAAAINTNGGAAGILQDITVLSGQWMNLDLQMRASGGAATAGVVVRNQHTLNYLTSAGAWQAAFAYVATETAAAYARKQRSFQVESFATTQSETTPLRIVCEASAAAGNCFFDNVTLYPAVDFCSIHGHKNVHTGMGCTLRSSDDNVTYAVEHTFAVRRPAFYGILSARSYHRYWRWTSGGVVAPLAPIELGEAVLGQTLTLTRNQDWGYELAYIEDHARNLTRNRQPYVTAQADNPRRVLRMQFKYDTRAAHDQARDQLYRLSRGDLRPLIVVPDDSDQDVVIFGRLDDEWAARRQFSTYWESDVIVTEDPLAASTT